MTSFAKQLKAEALSQYQTNLSEIPTKLAYHDAAKQICALWQAGGIGRKAKRDYTPTYPRYVFLTLGPTDRMSTEVNFFIEEIETQLNLHFRESTVEENGPVFRYGSQWRTMLCIFFHIGDNKTCRVVEEETEPTVVKNYKRQIVCDE